MSDPSFRPIGPDEAAKIAALFEAAYAPFRKTLPDLPDMTEGLAEELAETENWAAEDARGLSAVILLRVEDKALFIANLAVRPDTQGQGLARKLLEMAETRAGDLGLHRMLLTTHADMLGTIAVYKRLGFEVTERLEGALRMGKGI
jgi:ribosomal protein S18 acetylase RimI-like enzyme